MIRMRRIFLVCFLYSIVTLSYSQDDSLIQIQPEFKDINSKIVLPQTKIIDSVLQKRTLIPQKSIEDILKQSIVRDNIIRQKYFTKKFFENNEFVDTLFLKNLQLPYLLVNGNKISASNGDNKLFNHYNINSQNRIVLNPTIKIFSVRTISSNYVDYLNNKEKYIRNVKSINFNLSNTWLIPVIIISIIFLGISSLFYNKYFKLLLESAINYRLSVVLLKDKNIMLGRLSLILNTLFSINIALFLTQLSHYYSIRPFEINSFIYFLFFLIIVPFIFLIKSITNRIIGYIFNKGEIFNEYIHSYYVLNKNLGIILMPIVIILPFINNNFVPYLIILGIIIIAFYYFLRMIHGIKIILSKDVSILYLILYLCILEILPVFWMYKFIISFIVND